MKVLARSNKLRRQQRSISPIMAQREKSPMFSLTACLYWLTHVLGAVHKVTSFTRIHHPLGQQRLQMLLVAAVHTWRIQKDVPNPHTAGLRQSE